MMNKKKLGIYIHIPFCIQKCAYCDFLSGPAPLAQQQAYMQALQEEIKMTAAQTPKAAEDSAVSVFFGGGTPSVVDAEWIVQTMDTLRACYALAPDAEATIECNPGTLDREKAGRYRACGINRISLGLQSADNEQLRLLGRIHTFEAFQESYAAAQNAGFTNINVDLMAALPGQTLPSYTDGLKRVLALDPAHISAYSLILEENTPLWDQIASYPPLPDEDTERRMYYATQEILAAAGYRQYEISNFAKKGCACRHNLLYWERENYLGFGLGAASLYDGWRWSNLREMKPYTDGVRQAAQTKTGVPRAEKHCLTKDECMEEFMFLGLRKTEGISPDSFERAFGCTIAAVYGSVMNKHLKAGLLEWQSGLLRLTPRGVDVSNCVLADFLRA